MKLLKDHRGIEMLEAAITTPIAILVMLAIVNLGILVYGQQAVQAAARHGAAVAASAEINQQVFQNSGKLVPTSKSWGNAQSYVTLNTAGLSAKGVHAFVTGIQISGNDNNVSVNVSADLSILFPSVMPKVLVTQTGEAKLRALTH